MSPNLTPRRVGLRSQQPAPTGSGRRYPVEVDLRYKLFRGGTVIERGSGKTREFANGTVTFRVGRPLATGADLELSLDWPLRIDGVCPLQLLVFGRIVGCDKEGNTLKIARHEFRARASQVMAPRDAVNRSGFQVHAGMTVMHARRG